jgi:hypothetical protein
LEAEVFWRKILCVDFTFGAVVREVSSCFQGWEELTGEFILIKFIKWLKDAEQQRGKFCGFNLNLL